MDKIRINLLPPELKETEKKHNKLPILNLISLGVLVLSVVITAGVLFWSFYENQKYNNTTKEYEKLKKEISGKQKTELLNIFIKERVKNIKTLLSQDSPQPKLLNLVYNLAQTNASITQIRVDAKANLLLSGQSPTLPQARKFLVDIIDPTKNEGYFSKIMAEKFSKNSSGSYSFDLSIAFASGSAKIAKKNK